MSKNKNCKGNGPNVNTTQANVNQQMFELQDEIEHLGVEGQPNYQGIDQAKLVPLLVKTIQELEARITTLEG